MPLSYGQKIFLLATVPLVLAAAAIALVVSLQSRDLAEREIKAFETQLQETKKEELKNYISIARTAIVNVYGRAAPDDQSAKLAVAQELAAMLYGQDGWISKIQMGCRSPKGSLKPRARDQATTVSNGSSPRRASARHL